MIQKSNYQFLMELSADINRQVKESKAFSVFHRQHIANFYKRNKKNLDTAQNYFNEAKTKFLDDAEFTENIQKFLATEIEIYL